MEKLTRFKVGGRLKEVRESQMSKLGESWLKL